MRPLFCRPDKRKPPETLSRWRLCLPLGSPAVSSFSKRPVQAVVSLCAQRLTTACAACVQDLAASFCRHAGAKTVAVLANPVGRLERALHRVLSGLVAKPIKDSKPINISDLSFSGAIGACQRGQRRKIATNAGFRNGEMLQFVINRLMKLKWNPRILQRSVSGVCSNAVPVHLGSTR